MPGRIRSRDQPITSHTNISPSPDDVALIQGPLCANIDSAGEPNLGGEVIFLGRTRHEVHPTHGTLKALTYSAYESMAISQLNELAAQAKQHHGATSVRIHHALGHVAPGEISVYIQVRSGHRAEAFTACRWLIDELKQRVPIWKQEIWEAKQTWVTGTPPAQPEAPTK